MAINAPVLPALTQAWARRMCSAGGVVRYENVTGKGHETTAKDSATATLDWIDARFANRRARNDCGKI